LTKPSALIKIFKKDENMELFNTSILLNTIKLIVTILCTLLIVWQQTKKEYSFHPGVLIFVGVGSALLMIVAVTLSPGLIISKGKVAGNLAIGIGFIGAMSVVKEKQLSVGILTATTIWLIGAIGIAIGAGLFAEGLLATFLSFFAFNWINKNHQNQKI
jgi:putative Mg2+ transporter-C (MgtC) family protein